MLSPDDICTVMVFVVVPDNCICFVLGVCVCVCVVFFYFLFFRCGIEKTARLMKPASLSFTMLLCTRAILKGRCDTILYKGNIEGTL